MRKFSIRDFYHWWNHLSVMTRGLWVFFLLNGILLNLVFYVLPWDVGPTSANYCALFVNGHAMDDSWTPMAIALDHLYKFADVPVYSAVFFAQHVKFQYPPSALLILEMLRIIPSSAPHSFRLLNNISWFLVILSGCLAAVLMQKGTQYSKDNRLLSTSRLDFILRLTVILLLTITFYPITRGFYFGQIQTWLTFLGATALLTWYKGNKKTTGLLLGLICAVKPQWAIVFLWGLLRKQWGMVISGLAVFVALILISIYLYGFQHYPDYLKLLSFLAQHGESYHPNQSINGLVNRMLFLGNNLDWVSDGFPPFNSVVYTATLLSSVLLIGAALLWRWRDPSGTGVIEFAIILLSATIASPIAWEHHYGILLPIFAYIVPIAISTHPLGKWTAIYLIGAFVLASQRLGITDFLAATSVNFLQSYLLAAGLMVLLLLYRISYKARRRVQHRD